MLLKNTLLLFFGEEKEWPLANDTIIIDVRDNQGNGNLWFLKISEGKYTCQWDPIIITAEEAWKLELEMHGMLKYQG